MKIAFVMPNTLPMPAVKGGAVENILQNYIDLNENDGTQEITVFCKHDIEAEYKSRNYKYTRFIYVSDQGKMNYFFRYILGAVNSISRYRTGNLYIRKVANILKKDLYDYIIVENAPYYLPVIYKKLKTLPVIHIHNDYTRGMKEIVDQYSFGIVCVSNYIKDCYSSFQIHNKAEVLFNCINVSKFSFNTRDRDMIRNKYAIKSEELLFIYTGRIIRGKGILEMIQAFSKALKKRTNIKLLIVGGIGYSNNKVDDYLKECIERAKENEASIIFTGYVNYNDLPKYYSAADIGIIPSMLKEAAPLSAIEMIASGLPLIVNEIAGLREMASYGNSIFVKLERDYISSLAKAILDIDIKERKENRCNLDDFHTKCYKSKLENILERWLHNENS